MRATLQRVIMVMAVHLVMAGPALAQGAPAPAGTVLLTFDTEYPGDAEALEMLGFVDRATYFWTGAYAQKHPALLRHLAEAGNTIGSHSFHHDDLTTLSARQLQLDLELAKTVLEMTAGVPVTWFRAPYLEYNDAVMEQVADLGFMYDSSDSASRHHNRLLRSIAVSVHEDRLVSDYDIFETGQLDDAGGLDFLIRAYDDHARRGQALVVLMHPRIIGRHLAVLQGFMAHVQAGSGRFLTLDDHAGLLTGPKPLRRMASWADHDPCGTSRDDLRAAGLTDVFLTVPDEMTHVAGGREVFDAAVIALQGRGLRVHAVLPVNANAALAHARPTAAMTGRAAVASPLWVSPSHPEVRRRLLAAAADLVRNSGVDGIHLIGLGYPDLDHDFSLAALRRFGDATGVTVTDPDALLVSHYLTWTNWRADEILSLVQDVEKAVRPLSGPGFELSAALAGQAAIYYRKREATGQDFGRLARSLDLIILQDDRTFMADPAALRRMIFTAMTQVGATEILADAAHRRRQHGFPMAEPAAGQAMSEMFLWPRLARPVRPIAGKP